MNIFKILANGDGTINENNISAFLGYLLDPYADHGLGFEFLERVIEKLEIDDFNTKKYEYEILFEQAFKEVNKSKQIVDIVILCFEDNKGVLKESLVNDILLKERKLKNIFLIENKVKNGSKKKDQIKNQFSSTVSSLELDSQLVYSVYLTPDEITYSNEFANFSETENKTHLVWKHKSSENDSIYNILKELIEDENNGVIEAINEYTKHTIKSFIMFIENDFKSVIKEIKDNKEGKGKKDIFYEIEPFIDKYGDLLSEDSLNKMSQFTDYVKNKYEKITTRHSRAHACSVIFGKKIFGLTKVSKKLQVQLINRNPRLLNLLLQQYTEKIEELKLTPIKESWGYKIKETDIDLETIIKLFEFQLNILNIK
ncbi:MAG: PD-(D/E)XK nuclease family protein [Bacteroidales bacterium]